MTDRSVSSPPAASRPGRAGGSAEEPEVSEALERHRAGDAEAAFAVLHRRFAPAVLRYFHRKGFSDPQAEDLAQETWLEVHEGLDRFRGDCSFAGWLFILAESTGKQWLRKRGAAMRTGTEVAVEEMVTEPPQMREGARQEERVARRERSAAVRAAVAELPPQMQRCTLLYFYQQRTVAETAALLAVAEGTVKAHLFAARRKLAHRLGGVVEELGWPVGGGGSETR